MRIIAALVALLGCINSVSGFVPLPLPIDHRKSAVKVREKSATEIRLVESALGVTSNTTKSEVVPAKGGLCLFVLTSPLQSTFKATNEGTDESSELFGPVNPKASSDWSLPSAEGDAPRSRGEAFDRKSVGCVSLGLISTIICLYFRAIVKALTFFFTLLPTVIASTSKRLSQAVSELRTVCHRQKQPKVTKKSGRTRQNRGGQRNQGTSPTYEVVKICWMVILATYGIVFVVLFAPNEAIRKGTCGAAATPMAAFILRQCTRGIRHSLCRVNGRASDLLSRAQASFRLLCNRAAGHYISAIEGSHGNVIGVALQVFSFVAIAAAVACGICPSSVQIVAYTRTATALARGSTLLLEAKDWIRAAVEARFNQVKDATVSLVTTSTTALGRQARSLLCLASISRLMLACFGRRQVAVSIRSCRRLKLRVSDQLSRARVSLHLADQVGRYRTHCRIIDRRRL